MPTPRRAHQLQEFGKRVTGAIKRGRPHSATDDAVSARVRAIKERVNATAPDRPSCLARVWSEFADRIGMSERTLSTRLYNSPPTPFTVAELQAICREFKVRPDFLLLGRGPMFEAEAIECSGGGPTLVTALHSHAVLLLQAVTDQDDEWIESILPVDNELLAAVERGIVDASEDLLDARVSDRKLRNQSIRLAVSASVRASVLSPEVSDDVFAVATDIVEGRVICPPRGRDSRE